MTAIGINDQTMKMMWYDETYGFGKLSTFNVYMRILIKKKTNIRNYLLGYFNISSAQMDKIINIWLAGFQQQSEADLNSKTAAICNPSPRNLTVDAQSSNDLVCTSKQVTYL